MEECNSIKIVKMGPNHVKRLIFVKRKHYMNVKDTFLVIWHAFPIMRC